VKVGDPVTVVSGIDGKPHRCTIAEVHDDALPFAWFEAVDGDAAGSFGRRFARYLHEEHLDWAHGWDTVDAVALSAFAALEGSR